jgi:hypothetical protein
MTSWSEGRVTTWAKAALSLFNARSDAGSLSDNFAPREYDGAFADVKVR